MAKAPSSGIRLTETDAAIVKGMIARGDRQHDIAAWFGVNGGRIAEISSGDTFGDVDAASDSLPPPGPYLSGRVSSKQKHKLTAIREHLSGIIAEIDDVLKDA